MTIKRTNKDANIGIKIDHESKQMLEALAAKRGMDLSKLTRAVLINFIRPGTYQL